nr:MAG TPA: hypothetical protein [Caudoviricetes sp.]
MHIILPHTFYMLRIDIYIEQKNYNLNSSDSLACFPLSIIFF